MCVCVLKLICFSKSWFNNFIYLMATSKQYLHQMLNLLKVNSIYILFQCQVFFPAPPFFHAIALLRTFSILHCYVGQTSNDSMTHHQRHWIPHHTNESRAGSRRHWIPHHTKDSRTRSRRHWIPHCTTGFWFYIDFLLRVTSGYCIETYKSYKLWNTHGVN